MILYTKKLYRGVQWRHYLAWKLDRIKHSHFRLHALLCTIHARHNWPNELPVVEYSYLLLGVLALRISNSHQSPHKFLYSSIVSIALFKTFRTGHRYHFMEHRYAHSKCPLNLFRYLQWYSHKSTECSEQRQIFVWRVTSVLNKYVNVTWYQSI